MDPELRGFLHAEPGVRDAISAHTESRILRFRGGDRERREAPLDYFFDYFSIYGTSENREMPRIFDLCPHRKPTKVVY